jgi:ribosomal protein S18 acetylase RimI-like enzyme
MKIRSATVDDVIAVAKIHSVAFPNFFLTTLGDRFLRELYSGFLNHSSGIFFVADEAGNVVGFVAGTSSPDSFFPAMRQRRGLFFLINAIPAVLRNPMTVIRKLYTAIFYSGDKPVELENGALLSSLGVMPMALGKNVGRELLAQFESDAFSRGAEFVYLTTDEIGNDRVNAFYRKCGYHEESRFLQQAHRPMLRYVKNSNVGLIK